MWLSKNPLVSRQKAGAVLQIYILSLLLLLILFYFTPDLPETEASPATIYSGPQDGHVGSDNSVHTGGMAVGDTSFNNYQRGFVKFNLAGISGTLFSGTLKLSLSHSIHDGSIGFNPGLGNCLVRHIANYGTLDASDFNAPSIGNDPGVLISSSATPSVGYISIDVKAAMQDDINHGRPYTAFMIKLSIDTDHDGKNDLLSFFVSEHQGTGADPCIEYSTTIPPPQTWTTFPTFIPPSKTDWSLSSPSISPSSLKAGDIVTFRVSLQALSTTKPYPQTVKVIGLVDGVIVSSGSLSYSGPTGHILIYAATAPWTAIEGTHTLTWIVDPSPYAYNDPNRTNNEASLAFMVGPQPQPFDFSLTATPESQTIKAGETATFIVTANPISGTPSTVGLSIVGLPPGATSIFNPNMGDPTLVSKLKVTAAADTPQGTYTLTITGSGGGISRSMIITLSIETPLTEETAITPSTTHTLTASSAFTITTTPQPTPIETLQEDNMITVTETAGAQIPGVYLIIIGVLVVIVIVLTAALIHRKK